MERPDGSAFVSKGGESFPPTYEDNNDVRNFSDERKWPTKKLIGRLATYSSFSERPSIMQRARDTAFRIIEHILFELPYRGIVLTIDLDDEDTDTQPLDLEEITRLTGESGGEEVA